MSHYLGYPAAATLGYIHGNIKGAKQWTKAYHSSMSSHASKRSKYSHSVSAGTRRRGRSRTVTPTPATKRNRSVSSMSVSSRRSSLLTNSSARTTDRSLGSRASTVAKARTKKKIVKFHKNPKKVKIGRKFKSKVLKVLEQKEPHGYGQEMYQNEIVFPVLATKNLQEVEPIYGPRVDGIYAQYFTFTQILTAASVMWNKLPIATNVPVQQYTGAGMFNVENIKIECVKQWVTVKYRNNTQRTFYINIYASQRKSKAVNSTSMIQDWAGGLVLDYNAGVNVSNSLQTQLYNTPYLCKSVMDQWKIETTKVVLAPGEEYVYTLEGPSKVYDFRKNWINANYCVADKETVDLTHAIYTDLVGTTTGDYGRVSEKGNTTGYGLIYETNCYYKLRMPEQAGISWIGAGPYNTSDYQALPTAATGAAGVGITELGNRRDAFYFFTNPGTTATGTAVRIDRENPEDIKAN